jgi:hypothetical protein
MSKKIDPVEYQIITKELSRLLKLCRLKRYEVTWIIKQLYFLFGSDRLLHKSVLGSVSSTIKRDKNYVKWYITNYCDKTELPILEYDAYKKNEVVRKLVTAEKNRDVLKRFEVAKKRLIRLYDVDYRLAVRQSKSFTIDELRVVLNKTCKLKSDLL